MKPPLAVVSLLLSLFALANTAEAQTCSCKAPDSTCSIGASCKGGCTAICSASDACYAGCADVEITLLRVRISLKKDKAKSEEIASELSSKSKKKIEFLPRSEKPFNVEIKEGPLWNALDYLSRRGTVRVDGIDFRKFQEIRRMMLKGQRVAVNFDQVTVGDAATKLSSLSGTQFEVWGGDPGKLVSISLPQATLKEILAEIEAKTGAKIREAGKRASIR